MGEWEDDRARYMDYRRTLGYQMYGIMGVARDDRPGRAAAMNLNFECFGAPVLLIVTLDKEMGPPQWSDVGMFMQTFMLLAREAGLHTCPQEAWANWSSAVAEVSEQRLTVCWGGEGRDTRRHSRSMTHTLWCRCATSRTTSWCSPASRSATPTSRPRSTRCAPRGATWATG